MNCEQVKKGWLCFAIVIMMIFSNPSFVSAQNSDSYVLSKKINGSFSLVESGKSAPIVGDTKDFAGVVKVINDLQSDIANVTDVKPNLVFDSVPDYKEIVLIGTIGKNSIIDKLIEEKKISVDDIKGKWETFLIAVVEKPFPNVDRALIIAGSDKRGTIYGVYDLAEKIGVSPWYWWADVPVKKSSSIFIKPGRYSLGEPKVKYRGIFINDEAPALSGWSREKFGGFNSKFYKHVFELILRLKGNFLWPAMWGSAFYDDDSLNAKYADEYGVVISTSHHEPMMRAHDEWRRYGSGKWNYEKNDSALRDFWRKGIERMGDNESVITLAMRGDGDEAMSEDANVALLEKIVADQRKIIGDVTKKDVAAVPQVWALYKEVQEYYEKGMNVPDDVTLLLCDDNWGNLRLLPKLTEHSRKGGFGIYYHYDYVGGPRNYKWLNTTQIERVWEQMHLAYEYGAKQIWIVNVGDIKPMEFPISFFLDYAWDPEKINASDLPTYYKKWAEKQFGPKYSDQIAEILKLYTKYNSRRKPELLAPETYSLTNYREAETVVNEYNQLYEKAKKIFDEMPDEYKDAFYQLVLHPVEACSNLNEMLVTIGKNRLYAKQGRSSANAMADKARKLFDRDADITNYYNLVMAGGKWNHMMDQTHIGYTYWQQPDKNIMPEVKELNIPDQAEMGIAVEGSENWWPLESKEALLPEFDSINKQFYYIEIFNRGKTSFDYSITTSEPWLLLSNRKGIISSQERIDVGIDWVKVPSGKHLASIMINGTGKTVTIGVVINKIDSKGTENCFVESNGYISIEAEHYNRASGSPEISWLTIPNLGRTASSITPVPVISKSQSINNSAPKVEYDVFLSSSGELNVSCYFSPTLNFSNRKEGIRYAVSFDDEQPQIIKMTSNPNPPDLNHDPVWNRWVANNINIQTSKHKITQPGKHTLKIWMIDPGIVLQKIVIDNGNLKPSYLGSPESFRNLSFDK